MDRRLFIVAISPDWTGTLAYRTSAGWLLPWIEVDGQSTVYPRLQTHLAPLTAPAELLHTAQIPPDRHDRVPHGYCLGIVPKRTGSADLQMLTNDELDSTPAVMPRQRVAWRLALSRLNAPVAPYDTPQQISTARAWAQAEISRCLGEDVTRETHLRATRYDCITRYDTTGGAAYFKGGPERVYDEAETTSRLSQLSPRHFPETLLLDRDGCRWLYRELPGNTLRRDHLTMSAAVETVRTLAALQKKAVDDASLRDHLATSSLTAMALLSTANRVVDETWANSTTNGAGGDVREQWLQHCARMESICSMVDELQMPQTFVITDFWPGNVLATPQGIGFIDLGQTYWCYPFFTLSRYIKHVERSLRAQGAARAAIEDAFVAEWSSVIPPSRMRRVLPYLAFFNRMLGIVLKSRRLARWEQDLGGALPGWYRARHLSDFVHATIEASS